MNVELLTEAPTRRSRQTQLRAPSRGASLIELMARSIYPLDTKPTSEPKRITIELTPDEKRQVQLVADLFNAMDKVRGVKRARKWERKSVLEHFAREGLDTFMEQLGSPGSAELQDATIKGLIRKLEADHGKSKK